jgi:hypothetical protein
VARLTGGDAKLLTATTERKTAAMSHLSGSDEYNGLGELLMSWAVTADQARDTLDGATFGAGMIGMQTAMQRSRASGWVVPETRVEVRMQRRGPGGLYDAITRSLLLGRVGESVASLDRAVTHVAYDDPLLVAGPERAQHLAQRERPRAR